MSPLMCLVATTQGYSGSIWDNWDNSGKSQMVSIDPKSCLLSAIELKKKELDLMPEANSKARIIGRLFRLGFGVFFATEVIPVYQAVDLNGVVIRLGWALALVVFYLLVHLAVQKFGLGINPFIGALLANVPILAVFFIGYGGPAATGALTYLSPALIVAAIRADSGCEVMSIPALFTGKHTNLGCFLFSPIDWLEKNLGKN